ncbi:MAG: sulfide/dihydroorotate dehydrogenase-like FAD/NAD-binding protein [Deltaproteobacteria bacterium]|nr:sulfide/dihydroorotate dehydrogenase-like FAD/NAD-binding protein [Deltaproteobacteria bacterium]
MGTSTTEGRSPSCADLPATSGGFTIVEKQELAPKVTRYVVRAPDVARTRRAGQFVIVRVRDGGERIPLTIADADAAKGTITLVVQEVGKTTAWMASLEQGEALADVVGPLGRPTHIEKWGTVVCIGGGIGIAPSHPIVQAMRAAGNRVVAILGARTKDLLIMEDEMRRAADEVLVCTDDGSYGRKALVTGVLETFVAEHGKPDLVVAIGPPIMMKFVCKTTAPHSIPTVVSLNPVMVDGTGMCGGCRVTVGGKTKFVCVDGPEFDGHSVDFDEMMRRSRFYAAQEKESFDRWRKARGEDGGGP